VDPVHTDSAIIRFGVTDVETSGLDPGRDHVLQIALVTVAVDPATWASTVESTWACDIRLRHPFQRIGPREVHHLSRWRLILGTPAERALTEFSAHLGSSIFTAHNAAFDASFIEVAAQRARVALTLDPVLCTLRLSRQLDPGRHRSHRLGDLCERYGVGLDRPHDALEDALATAAVLPHLLREHGIASQRELAPHYIASPERYR